MFDLEVLYSRDNHKIVGFFTRSHVDATLLLQAAVNYHSDPEYIDENFNPTNVLYQYWEIDTESDEEDDDSGLEYFSISDSDKGFPVTVFYLDSGFKIL